MSSTEPRSSLNSGHSTTERPFDIVNNPDSSQVVDPVDTRTPVAQPSCGIQIFSGQNSRIITWCRFYNDSYELMKTDVAFNIMKQFYDVKIEFYPERDDAIDVTWCIVVNFGENEITDLCGIPSLSTNTKLFLHVFSHNNFIPPITDRFNIFATKAYFKDLILPAPSSSLCRYGEPFRGGTNSVIKYEVGIGSARLLTDIVTFREVIKPCIPCYGNCSKYNCDSNCDPNKHVVYSFTLTNLNLDPFVMEVNETGHESNRSWVYYFTVKAVSGSGAQALASSSEFYVDTTPPVFEPDAMLFTPIYVDVLQGEFTPVKYQSSNKTIKAFWECYDKESRIKDNLWAVGITVGGEELQPFQSVGKNQIGINSTFEGVLEHNTTYYVSIICVNGGGLTSQWNDSIGVIPLLEPPTVDNINSTVIGATEFTNTVTPNDAKETKDPTKVGITFSVSEDPSVKRYDMCIGTDENFRVYFSVYMGWL